MNKYLTKASAVFLSALCIVAFAPVPAHAASFVGQHQYLGDVNGDGVADAVTYDPRTGDWWIAPSDGTQFTPPSRWISGFAINSSKQFVVDITGDGLADLVTYDAGSGDWWAVVSTGFNSFSTPFRWIHGHGVGSKTQLMGDVNGDGKADAVIFFDLGMYNNMSGTWWVATANVSSNGFDAPGQWYGLGHGTGSSNQLLGDVDADGLADAVTFDAKTGDWYAAYSNGSSFTIGYGATKMAANWGSNSPMQFLADVNGDGGMDAVISDAPYGITNHAALTDGNGFGVQINMSGMGKGNSNMIFADVDLDAAQDQVVFDKYAGSWTVDGATWITGFGVGTN